MRRMAAMDFYVNLRTVKSQAMNGALRALRAFRIPTLPILTRSPLTPSF